MRKFNRMIVAGALAVTLMLAPTDMAAAKTVAVVQTADGEQTVTYYDISFDANKGKKVKTTLTLSYKEVYGKLPKTTRTGYKFLGWYTKKTGGTKVTAKTVFKGKDDQTLYAHWKKVVTEEPQTSGNPPAEESAQQEVSQTPEIPDLPVVKSALVNYASNTETD